MVPRYKGRKGLLHTHKKEPPRCPGGPFRQVATSGGDAIARLRDVWQRILVIGSVGRNVVKAGKVAVGRLLFADGVLLRPEAFGP